MTNTKTIAVVGAAGATAGGLARAILDDPQGGYAMIRPGGGCPACDAMAGAR